jgi:hypothetical protein
MKTTTKSKHNTIYFISHDQPEQHNIIKVGTAQYFDKRISSYLTAFPFGVRVHLLLQDWYDNTEGYWLNHFASLVIDGEWHEFNEEAFDVLAALQAFTSFTPYSVGRKGMVATALQLYRRDGLGTDHRG